MKCNVAIIGAGNMAREHVRSFLDTPGVTIAGIHSRTRSRAEALAAEFNVEAVYDSIPQMYEKTRADLVVVTVSEMAMVPVSLACFEFPWTVMLEKPAGLNVPDAEEIYASATSNRRRVLVALNRQFLSSTQAALADLDQNQGPRFVKVQDQQDKTEAKALGFPQEVVDNWMYANSIHVIDYFRLFGRGHVKRVSPVICWNPETPGVVVSSIEFDSGDVGLYEGIWNGPGPWAVSISTAEKRWEMRPLEQASYQLSGERRSEQVAVHDWDREFKPGFRLQAEMAVATALGRPSTSPTLEESLETMRLIQAIFKNE